MSKRRRKRLFPKKFSASSISVSRIDPNKAAAYNAQRSRATEGGRASTFHKIDNNFMEVVPDTRSLSTIDYDLEVSVRSERGKVVDRKHELMKVEAQGLYYMYRVWQGKRGQGVSEFFQLTVEKHEGYVMKLFFSGQEFMFVSEVSLKNIRRISRIYKSRDEAMYYKNSNRIAWIDEELLT